MIRKLKRSIAREAMKNDGIKLFGKYAPCKTMRRNKRTGNIEEVEVMRSVFSRKWRDYL